MKWNDTRMGLTLFMRKRKVPTQPDLIAGGTISTTTVNNNENQVSAANFKVGATPDIRFWGCYFWCVL